LDIQEAFEEMKSHEKYGKGKKEKWGKMEQKHQEQERYAYGNLYGRSKIDSGKGQDTDKDDFLSLV